MLSMLTTMFGEGGRFSRVLPRTGRTPGRNRGLHAVALAALLTAVSLPATASPATAVETSGTGQAPVASTVSPKSAEARPSTLSQNYAAREASAPGLEKFEGGDSTIVIGGTTLVVILLVVLILVLI